MERVEKIGFFVKEEGLYARGVCRVAEGSCSVD